MRKISIVIIILLASWLASLWYLGTKSEQSFKAFMITHKQQIVQDSFKVDLLHFRKTLMGAKAGIRIHHNLPFLSDQLENLELNVQLENGPFFIDTSSISFGSFRWIFTVNNDALSLEEREYIAALFPKRLPNMLVRLGFDDIAYYKFDEEVSNTHITVNGTLDESQNHEGTVVLKDSILNFSRGELVGEKIQLNYSFDREVDFLPKHLKVNFQIPVVTLNLNNKIGVFEYSLQGKADVFNRNNVINSSLEASLKSLSSEQLLVESAGIRISLKGMLVDGLIRYSEAIDSLYNLKQQAKWQLEESGEFPEGQDQVWQSYDQIDSLSQDVSQIVKNEIFKAHNVFQVEVKAGGNEGESTLIGSLKHSASNNKKREKSILDSVKTSTSLSLLKLLLSALQGEAKVKLNDGLFQALSNKTPINKKDFRLIWNENKLLMK